MTTNEVIELGRKIVKPEFHIAFSHPFLLTTALIVGIALLFLLPIKEGASRFWRITGYCFLLGGYILLDSLGVEYNAHKQYEEDLTKWKSEVALPFIATLPSEKKEIIFIKIDAELTATKERPQSDTRELQRTALTISYKDNGKLVTKTDWFDINMTLTSESEPYIEYTKLNKHLGHGVSPGNYGTKIYLPESYKFTDIK